MGGYSTARLRRLITTAQTPATNDVTVGIFLALFFLWEEEETRRPSPLMPIVQTDLWCRSSRLLFASDWCKPNEKSDLRKCEYYVEDVQNIGQWELSFCVRPQCSSLFALLYAECISSVNTRLELRAHGLVQLLLSTKDASDGSWLKCQLWSSVLSHTCKRRSRM